jgi:hypothetical protein
MRARTITLKDGREVEVKTHRGFLGGRWIARPAHSFDFEAIELTEAAAIAALKRKLEDDGHG